jgi:dTDP-4-dehydrorhamnose reductase
VRVLVTGAGGQLGLDLLDAFADHAVVGRTRVQLDVTDAQAVAAVVQELRPAVVLDAAAWTDVDGCERDPERAHRVNALGPWHLARACGDVGARLVTVSSDHVFGGGTAKDTAATQRRPRSELDPVAPVNAYGRSKAEAERLVRGTLPEHLIVRTGWLAGARGDNFVTRILRLARERGRLEVVDDQVGALTRTRDLAAAIRELVTHGHHGTVHRTATGWCSRYELARATVRLAGLGVPVEPVTSETLGRDARRPTWSVLDDGVARRLGLAPLPTWQDGLTRLLDELGELRSPGSAA